MSTPFATVHETRAHDDGFIRRLVAKLTSFDGVGDAYFDRLRGNETANQVARVLSTLSDYGVVWVLLAAWLARKPGPQRKRTILALALAGVGSYTLNKAVKNHFERERPSGAQAFHENGGIPLRRPSSPSFPSGHTMAAFAAAIAIPPSMGGVALASAFASAIALSRVQLKAHHLSDVLAGASLGIALGLIVRAALSIFGVGATKAS